MLQSKFTLLKAGFFLRRYPVPVGGKPPAVYMDYKTCGLQKLFDVVCSDNIE